MAAVRITKGTTMYGSHVNTSSLSVQQQQQQKRILEDSRVNSNTTRTIETYPNTNETSGRQVFKTISIIM